MTTTPEPLSPMTPEGPPDATLTVQAGPNPNQDPKQRLRSRLPKPPGHQTMLPSRDGTPTPPAPMKGTTNPTPGAPDSDSSSADSPPNALLRPAVRDPHLVVQQCAHLAERPDALLSAVRTCVLPLPKPSDWTEEARERVSERAAALLSDPEWVRGACESLLPSLRSFWGEARASRMLGVLAVLQALTILIPDPSGE